MLYCDIQHMPFSEVTKTDVRINDFLQTTGTKAQLIQKQPENS